MKLRRVLSLTVAIAIVLSLFNMVLPAGAAGEEIFVECKETRDRTIYNIYSDEEMMQLLKVDYETLERMSVEAYKAVMTNTNWDVSSYGVLRNSDAAQALFDLLYRNPECFFVRSLSYSYNTTSNKITKIVPKYSFSYDECMKMHGEFVAAAQEIICYFGRDKSLTDLELALLVHDYLVSNYEYYYDDIAVEKDTWGGRYTGYDLLVKGMAVCQGYASAYAYLMKELGVTCGYCRSSQLNHIWNIIEIDGVEYQVDLTWDDPSYDRSGYTKHTNFLRSTDGMTATGHKANDITGSTTATKYDSAFWQSMDSPFCYYKGMIYYIDNTKGVLCSWEDGVTTELFPLECVWSSSTGYNYPQCYSYLATDGESLFFSVPKRILKYDPETNTTEPVYTYTDADDAGRSYRIFGFSVSNNKFYIDVYSGPYYSSVTAKKENQIVYTYREGNSGLHSYTDITYTKVPSCTASGERTYKCEFCDAAKTETVAPLGHDYTVRVVAPTCATQGYTVHTCARCFDSYTDNYTDKTGHSYIYTATKKPTQSSEGELTGLCSACSAVREVSLPKLSMTDYIVLRAKEAGCTTTGQDRYTWANSAYGTFSFLVEVPALGHNYTAKETSPTCTESGYTTYTCTRCFDSYKDLNTDPTGHNYTSRVTVEPTCTGNGVNTYTCANCNHSYTESIPATGHTTVIDPAVTATCTNSGLTEGSHCAVCNMVIDAQTVVPAFGHNYTSHVAMAPTCITAGVEVFSCSNCGRSYTKEIAATGHTVVVDPAVAATCTDSGLTEGKHCSVCNTVLVAQEFVARLGHDYSNHTNNGDTHTATCSRCDKTQTSEHSYTDGTCICGAKEIVEPILDENINILHTLNLASDIAVTFAVSKTTLANYDSYYLECVIPKYEGNTLVGSTTVQIQPVLTGSYYYFTLTGITAVQMNDTVDAVLHMTKGEQEYYSKTDRYSVATYAYKTLNESKDAKMLTLCADLLRYGAEAQSYKKYRTDALVDADMTETHRSYLSSTATLTFSETDSYLADLSNPTITWVGKTLDLGSKVGIKFVFNTKNYTGDLANLSMKVTYVNSQGEITTVTLTGAEAYGTNGTYYSFTFYGLLASELRTAIDVAVYEGETRLSETMRYSAETYASKTVGNALEPLTRALFAYSDSAKAYFTK